jgi:predicted metalloprotease with PDZ domain
MRQLWRVHGKTEKPYSITDLENALATITNKSYATNFFTKYVYGHQPFDYAEALSNAGLQLSPISVGKAWLGDVSLVANPEGLAVSRSTVKNTPIYNAGVDVGDVILEADRKKLSSAKDFEDILSKHQPGDRIQLLYKHRNNIIEKEVTLEQSKWVKVTAAPTQNTATDNFKAAWLGSKAR